MRTYILNATGTDISPATIIICVVIAAICIFAVISYRKKLKNGCCGGGGDEVKHVKPQDTNVNDYDHVYRMDIEGMHCKNCAMRIENAFNEQRTAWQRSTSPANSLESTQRSPSKKSF